MPSPRSLPRLTDRLLFGTTGLGFRAHYWRTESGRAGFLFLSANAGTLRRLVPTAVRQMLSELPPPGTPAQLDHSELDGKPIYQFI